MEAFRTSQVACLYVEADKLLLYSRREKLSLPYAIRFAANPSNPAHKVAFPPKFLLIHLKRNLNPLKSFGLRISPPLASANINPENIETYFIQKIPVRVFLNKK